MSYDILKKHETLINHYHVAQSLGNGWGAQLQEIQTVIPANLNCGVCIGDMLNTAYHMLQRMEKQREQLAGIKKVIMVPLENIQLNDNTKEKPKASEPKKRGNPNFGKK